MSSPLFEIGKTQLERLAIKQAARALVGALYIAEAKVAANDTPEGRTVVKLLKQITGLDAPEEKQA